MKMPWGSSMVQNVFRFFSRASSSTVSREWISSTSRIDSLRMSSAKNDYFRNDPASDRRISIISWRMTWDLRAFRKIRSNVAFSRSLRRPFRSARRRRLAVLAAITDKGPERSWIRSSNRRSFSSGSLPGIGSAVPDVLRSSRKRQAERTFPGG